MARILIEKTRAYVFRNSWTSPARKKMQTNLSLVGCPEVMREWTFSRVKQSNYTTQLHYSKKIYQRLAIQDK